MTYEILQIDYQGPVVLVTMNRPEALNALNTRFFDEMDAAISEIAEHKEVRAMVITGEGKAFVAGADIAEMVDKSPKEGSDFGRRGQITFENLENMEVPVIAAINGFALGGGLELAMACDIRIASVKAKFGQPEVNLGLIPGYAGTQRLPKLVGMGNALYLLTTAEMIGAEDALRMGLVQKVTEPETLLEEAMKMAGTIASKGPKAVKKVKFVTRHGADLSFKDGSALENTHFGSLFKDEGETGMKAFLEKRQPEW